MKPIKVAIVNKHSLVRTHITNYYKHNSEVKMIGAYKGSDLLFNVDPKLDLVILDLHETSFKLISKLRHKIPDVKILFYSITDKPEMMEQVLRCGAHGCILKKAGPEKLTQAIRIVAHGGRYYGTHVLHNYITSFPNERIPRSKPLRSRPRKRV